MKTFQIFSMALSTLIFTYSCVSRPIEAQATIIIPSTIPTKSATPMLNGLAIRETERVGTVHALQTASTTPLPSSLPTNTLTPEPTLTPKPLSSNDVLISYTRYAGDGTDEITSCLNAYYLYRFVLYRDGQLIAFDKTRYLETIINQSEIDKLLSEIDRTGFSSLIGNGDQYIRNAPTPSFANGWGSNITVSGKSIIIDDMQSNYVIESVANTLDIIANYKPKDLKPYIPESIVLFVFQEHGAEFESFQPAAEGPVLNWSVDSIDLYNMVVGPLGQQPHYVSGYTVSFLMQQLKTVPTFRKVEQNGQSYLVLACPNFTP